MPDIVKDLRSEYITNKAVINEITAPSGNPEANTGWLYIKDNAGTTDLYFEDDSGSVIELTAAGGGGYTNEEAQDAIGSIVVDTETIDVTYTDATPELKWDVKDGSITYAKMQAITSGKLLGAEGGTTVEEIAIGTGLSLATNTLSSSITQYTDELAQDAIGTILSDSDDIDFTYNDSTPSISAVVKSDSITYAKIQNVSDTNKVLGRSTAGAGDIEEIACTAAGRALIDDTSSSAQRITLGIDGYLRITIESPGSAEDVTIGFTDYAITIVQAIGVLTGSATPSVTYQVRHHTDRNNAGNALFASPQVVTSTTTGDEDTSFSDATIPADSWVWLETTAQSGTVLSLHLTLRYTID
jgi:hypothetical protein